MRAGTPTKVIEIAPDESTTYANRRGNGQELLRSDDGDAAWDRLDEEFGEFNELDDEFNDLNTEIEGDSLHNVSNHSYQSLVPEEDNNFPQRHQDPEEPRPITLEEQREQAAEQASPINPNFRRELEELSRELQRRRETQQITNEPILASTPEDRRDNTSPKMELERAAKFKEVFSGSKDQNIEAFFDRFELWCDNHGHGDDFKAANFVLCLDGPAYSVYKSLDEEIRQDY